MNQQTTIEGYLNDLAEIIDKAWSLPFSGGKVFVDADEIKQLVTVIREFIPSEINKAKSILNERDQIIEQAKIDSASIMKQVEERVRAMVNQEEITRQAQAKANELIQQGQLIKKEMCQKANEYVDDIMKQTDASVSTALADLRKTRQMFSAAQQQNNQQ